MYRKLQVEYNVDKLILIYEIPDGFMSIINDQCQIPDIFNPSNVFIFTKKIFRKPYVVVHYELSWRAYGDCDTIKIAEFKNDISGCITLNVYNEFLYSGKLHLLYEFEQTYRLQFQSIKQLDVCCDSSVDLPKKLDAIMHNRRCEVTRRGRKKTLTEQGNQLLGIRVSDNIKALTDKIERPRYTYYFTITPSGAKRPLILRGYNKTKEVKEKKKKEYILNQYSFSPVYRFEVSIHSYELIQLSKSSTGWSQDYIYAHLSDKTFLKDFFRRYINRTATLTIDGRRHSITEYLRLE